MTVINSEGKKEFKRKVGKTHLNINFGEGMSTFHPLLYPISRFLANTGMLQCFLVLFFFTNGHPIKGLRDTHGRG